MFLFMQQIVCVIKNADLLSKIMIWYRTILKTVYYNDHWSNVIHPCGNNDFETNKNKMNFKDLVNRTIFVSNGVEDLFCTWTPIPSLYSSEQLTNPLSKLIKILLCHLLVRGSRKLNCGCLRHCKTVIKRYLFLMNTKCIFSYFQTNVCSFEWKLNKPCSFWQY